MRLMRQKRMRPYSYRGRRAPRWLTALAALMAAGLLVFAGLFGAVLYGSYDHIQGEPQAMVVLGCRVMPGGEPSILLQDRLDTALDYWETGPTTRKRIYFTAESCWPLRAFRWSRRTCW